VFRVHREGAPGRRKNRKEEPAMHSAINRRRRKRQSSNLHPERIAERYLKGQKEANLRREKGGGNQETTEERER